MGALVIKSWAVKNEPIDSENTYIEIVGRQGGLIAWLFTLLGIDVTTKLRITSEKIEFSDSSLAGTNHRLIPLESVCSTYYGYFKPWLACLIWGLVFIPLTFGISVIAAMIYYFLNRRLTVGFVEDSGVINGIQFKRSVIENIDVNEEATRQVCELTEALIDFKKRRYIPAAPADPAA
jgi:hypothetical protein